MGNRREEGKGCEGKGRKERRDHERVKGKEQRREGR